jgi:ParB-like chromosome segregation protein Spo0J
MPTERKKSTTKPKADASASKPAKTTKRAKAEPADGADEAPQTKPTRSSKPAKTKAGTSARIDTKAGTVAPIDVGGVTLEGMTFASMALEDLRPADYNPRTIDEQAKAGLAVSLATFGCVEPIVYNKRTGRVVGGHQRLAVMLDAGVKRTAVSVIDVDEDTEKALNVSLNNPRTQGRFTEQLATILGEVGASDVYADLLGELRLDGLAEELGLALEGVADYEPNTDADEGAGKAPPPHPAQGWKVVVHCEDEDEAVELRDRLAEEGYDARATA